MSSILTRRMLGQLGTTRSVIVVAQSPIPRHLPNSGLLCHHRCFEQSYSSEGGDKRSLRYPAFLTRFFGLGGSKAASAHAGKPADGCANNLEEMIKKQTQDIDDLNLEKFFLKQRREIEDLLQSKGMELGPDFRFTLPIKSQGVIHQQKIVLKQDNIWSPEEFDAVVPLQLSGNILGKDPTTFGRANEGSAEALSIDNLITTLESMGVSVYGVDKCNVTPASKDISWDNLAGYDLQKQQIEDIVLLALLNPEMYDEIARGTRRKFKSNRPRAVLFEGPPGTGKTSSARVIANQAGVPLLYVPLEVIMCKYFGESERLLGNVFSLANKLPDGAIIFLDEVDSFATSRDGDLFEGSRRILSVLLRQIDGFEQDKKVVLIAATNRKQDLDPALISRFKIIRFGLPDHQERKAIADQYAKHLTESDLDDLAGVTEGMSGRDIVELCEETEQSWAAKVIRGQVPKDTDQILLPPLLDYIASAMNRRKATLSSPQQQTQNSESNIRKARIVFD